MWAAARARSWRRFCAHGRRSEAYWSICRERWPDRAGSSRQRAWRIGSGPLDEFLRPAAGRRQPLPSEERAGGLARSRGCGNPAALRQAARPAGRVVVLGGVTAAEKASPNCSCWSWWRKDRTLGEFRKTAREADLEVRTTFHQPSGRFAVECVPRVRGASRMARQLQVVQV